MFQKLTIIIAVIILCSSMVLGQEFQKSITGKGFKIGPGFSEINTSYDEIEKYFETKIGSHFGAFLTYQITSKLSIQPELLSEIGIGETRILSGWQRPKLHLQALKIRTIWATFMFAGANLKKQLKNSKKPLSLSPIMAMPIIIWPTLIIRSAGTIWLWKIIKKPF